MLRTLHTQAVVPYAVVEEISAGGKDIFGLDVFVEFPCPDSVLVFNG